MAPMSVNCMIAQHGTARNRLAAWQDNLGGQQTHQSGLPFSCALPVKEVSKKPRVRAPFNEFSMDSPVLLGRAVAPATVISKAKSTANLLSERGDATAAPSGDLLELPLTKRLAELVRHGGPLKVLVANCFKQVAASNPCPRDTEGKTALSLSGLARLREVMAKALGVPEQAFGNLHNEYVRFDFDGDGMLQEHECYKIAKYHLREYQKKIDPSTKNEVSIPYKSVQSAGYRLSKELGSGSQGVMKLALDRDGAQRCIKLVRKNDLGAAGMSELKEEFEFMNNLKNERIARTFEIFQDNAFYYLVNEPYFGGDLTKLRSNASEHGVTITLNWWRAIFKQCFEGLYYLHKHAMMHCDIKEPNLMLKTDNFHKPEVVIIDFGVAQEDVCDRQRVCGTPGYIPPETWDTTRWFPKGDCFSLGVTMMQLLIDQVPAIGKGPDGAPKMLKLGIFSQATKSLDEIAHVTRTRRPPMQRLPKECGGLTRLLEKLLEKRQEMRMNASQAVNDPWFTAPSVGDTPLPPPIQEEGAQQACGMAACHFQPRASGVGALGAGMFIAAFAANSAKEQAQLIGAPPASPLPSPPQKHRTVVPPAFPARQHSSPLLAPRGVGIMPGPSRGFVGVRSPSILVVR